MSNQTAIKLFENTCAARSASRKVRSVWDAEAEKFLLTLTGLSTLSGHTANDLSGYEVADRVDSICENQKLIIIK